MYQLNLTENDVKFLQFLAMKNEERLSGIISDISKDEPKGIKVMYRKELSKNKKLSRKLRINIY